MQHKKYEPNQLFSGDADMIWSADNFIRLLGKDSNAPDGDEAFNEWIQLEHAASLLQLDTDQEDLLIYATLGSSTLIHAIATPREAVEPPDIEDLLRWNFNAYSSWGITYNLEVPPVISIESPLINDTGSKSLEGSERLVFARDFTGRAGDTLYIEILQKLTQIFELHWLTEKSAYCRIDSNGDLDSVISVLKFSQKVDGFRGNAVTVKREIIDDYMHLTRCILVRTFDFARRRPERFIGWGQRVAESRGQIGEEIFYSFSIYPGYASHLRGVQLLSPAASYEETSTRLTGHPKKKEYESYIAHDWKNEKIAIVSCAPGATANYFIDSSLPFEVSPAFFRAEVLAKYKADPDKYELSDRSISCRGAWHLETYDINEAGQVHTYLVYLRHLPQSEQLHWKAYNEPPKADISERARKTDFEGEWDESYDPLSSLRQTLSKLERDQTKWWTLRNSRQLSQIQYPITPSTKEWRQDLLMLHQLVVEGFKERWLRQQAVALGGEDLNRIRSLKLVERCLIGLDFEEEQARNITSPLHGLHKLRSEVAAHASEKHADEAVREILEQHGTFRAHFRSLCEACDKAMRTIEEAFRSLDT